MKAIWDSTLQNETTKFYERFVATSSGLYAMFPATHVDEDFDFMITDWFNTAIDKKDNLVLTPPRSSEYDRCDVITIAHTLLEGK